MKKIPFETILEDAKKYNTRGDWSKHSMSKYGVACRNGWLEECCAHMVRQMNPYTDDIGVVYAFIFNDDQVYIGLTVNPRKRFLAHINERGPVYNKIQQGFTYEYKILEENISNTNLAERELFYIDEFKKAGKYKMINKQRGGRSWRFK